MDDVTGRARLVEAIQSQNWNKDQLISGLISILRSIIPSEHQEEAVETITECGLSASLPTLIQVLILLVHRYNPSAKQWLFSVASASFSTGTSPEPVVDFVNLVRIGWGLRYVPSMSLDDSRSAKRSRSDTGQSMQRDAGSTTASGPKSSEAIGQHDSPTIPAATQSAVSIADSDPRVPSTHPSMSANALPTQTQTSPNPSTPPTQTQTSPPAASRTINATSTTSNQVGAGAGADTGRGEEEEENLSSDSEAFPRQRGLLNPTDSDEEGGPDDLTYEEYEELRVNGGYFDSELDPSSNFFGNPVVDTRRLEIDAEPDPPGNKFFNQGTMYVPPMDMSLGEHPDDVAFDPLAPTDAGQAPLLGSASPTSKTPPGKA